jgi:hypothetical protein
MEKSVIRVISVINPQSSIYIQQSISQPYPPVTGCYDLLQIITPSIPSRTLKCNHLLWGVKGCYEVLHLLKTPSPKILTGHNITLHLIGGILNPNTPRGRISCRIGYIICSIGD